MRYHVRRKDLEITAPEMLKKILKATKFITIAMAKENEPYLVSLSHGYDESGNCLYFHCADEGKKLDFLGANNTVWGQALLDRGYVEGECNHLYASVHFLGQVTFIDDIGEKLKALDHMKRHLKPDPEHTTAQTNAELLKGTVVGRIDIEYMTGKKSKEVEA